MKNTDIYRVDEYLQIETITVTHLNKKYAIGPSNVRKERVVPIEKIESSTNPVYTKEEVRYFDNRVGAENYIHNAMVHGVQSMSEASDREIIDILLTTDMESLPGEVAHALVKRAENVKTKLSPNTNNTIWKD